MTYCLEIINAVLNDLRNNVKFKTIAEKYTLTYNTVRNWMYKYDTNIKNNTPVTEIKRYKHKVLKQEFYNNKILNYVEENPIVTLDKINKQFNKEISITTIYKILKKNNISRKKVNLRYVNKDINLIEEDRRKYASTITDNEFFNYLHLDETGISINNNHIHCYTKKGKEFKKLVKHKHSREHYSCLSVISNNEIVAYEIVKGSLNAELYKNFLAKNSEKLKNKIIIQDNLKVHHAKIVKKFIDENQIKFKFLPAYTPEFNPIEMSFNQLKKHLKKCDFKDIVKDIKNSLTFISSENLNNYYKHSLKEIYKYKNFLLN